MNDPLKYSHNNIAYPCRPPKWLWLVDMRICPHLRGETLPGPLWWLVQLWWNWIQEWSVMDLRWFWVVARIPGLLRCHFQYLLSQGERPADGLLFFSASVKYKIKRWLISIIWIRPKSTHWDWFATEWEFDYFFNSMILELLFVIWPNKSRVISLPVEASACDFFVNW